MSTNYSSPIDYIFPKAKGQAQGKYLIKLTNRLCL